MAALPPAKQGVGTACSTEIGALDSVLSVEVDVDAARVTVTTTDEPDDALFAKVAHLSSPTWVGPSTKPPTPAPGTAPAPWTP
ncbi:hypothetical protein [Streptomyces sp. 7N604]|uniref:hypothetical protein n=1 Tax=Streptomyces sp. 7N604 TaxID=3457415 RepID=UPI003FD1BAF9